MLSRRCVRSLRRFLLACAVVNVLAIMVVASLMSGGSSWTLSQDWTQDGPSEMTIDLPQTRPKSTVSKQDTLPHIQPLTDTRPRTHVQHLTDTRPSTHTLHKQGHDHRNASRKLIGLLRPHKERNRTQENMDTLKRMNAEYAAVRQQHDAAKRHGEKKDETDAVVKGNASIGVNGKEHKGDDGGGMPLRDDVGANDEQLSDGDASLIDRLKDSENVVQMKWGDVHGDKDVEKKFRDTARGSVWGDASKEQQNKYNVSKEDMYKNWGDVTTDNIHDKWGTDEGDRLHGKWGEDTPNHDFPRQHDGSSNEAWGDTVNNIHGKWGEREKESEMHGGNALGGNGRDRHAGNTSNPEDIKAHGQGRDRRLFRTGQGIAGSPTLHKSGDKEEAINQHNGDTPNNIEVVQNKDGREIPQRDQQWVKKTDLAYQNDKGKLSNRQTAENQKNIRRQRRDSERTFQREKRDNRIDNGEKSDQKQQGMPVCVRNKVAKLFDTAVFLNDNFFSPYLDQMTCTEDRNAAIYGNGFVNFRNLMIDPSKTWKKRIHLRGGEQLEDVWGNQEALEHFNFYSGYFQIECSRPPRFPFHPRDKLATWGFSLSCRDQRSSESSRTIPGLTLAIQRFEYVNLYHAMTDFYNAFVLMLLFGARPSDVNILIVDLHPQGGLDPVWGNLFANVIRAGHLTEPTSFPNLAWGLTGYASPLRDHTRKDLPYVEEFRRFFLTRHNVTTTPHQLNCSHPNVLFIWRRDYIAHPRNRNGTLSRKFSNEDEMLQQAWETFGNDANISGHQLELLPMQEQVRMISQTDVMVGMHGAGLSHALFLPPSSGVLEIRNKYFITEASHFQAMAHWRNLHYIAWRNTESKNEVDTFRTKVPLDVLHTQLKDLYSKICKRT